MAYLEVKFHENRLEITSQVFCCEFHDTWENRKVLFVMLRALCSPETGNPLFSYQTIADAFGDKTRQNINNFVREYEQCDENVFDYLRHKRKVEPQVVEAVTEELRKHVLIRTGVLRERINQRLGRRDLTSANIRVALEQIPCTVIRQRVLREIKVGAFHPKEEVVLAELFSVLAQEDGIERSVPVRSFALRELPVEGHEVGPGKSQNAHDRGENLVAVGSAMGAVSPEELGHADTRGRYAEIVSAAGIQAIREEADAAVIQKIQADSVQQVLTPNFPLSELPDSVVRMVTAMTMYHSGASLSQIGRWFGGKAKSTIYTWIMGFALALWPVIRGWVWSHVKGTRVYLDEKWLKIRKKWDYWFVAVAQDTGLPFFHDLLPGRSKWACRLFVLKLKRLGKRPSVMMTAGLKGYVSAIARVFPTAKQLLCLFHHQQSVTRCVNEYFSETEQTAANVAKKRMKPVVQTTDTRTVRRRLNRLEQVATEQGWNILTWIKQTRNRLTYVLPACAQIVIRQPRTKLNAFSEHLFDFTRRVAVFTRSKAPNESSSSSSWSIYSRFKLRVGKLRLRGSLLKPK